MAKKKTYKPQNFMLITVVLAIMAAHTMAQEPFSVKTMPFRRYVKLTSSDVNLRKGCSTSSPRLIVDRSWGQEIYSWENGRLGPNEKPAHAKVLPLWEPYFVKNLRVADGWLCGQFQDKHVFVMEKFCQDTSLRSLPRTEKLDFEAITVINDGKYKDYFVAASWELDGEDESVVVSMGKYVDGVFIVNYSLPYGTWPVTTAKEFLAVDKDGSGQERLYLKYNDDVLDLASDPVSVVKKLVSSEQNMDFLMLNCTKINFYKPVHYFAVEGVKGWHKIVNAFY